MLARIFRGLPPLGDDEVDAFETFRAKRRHLFLRDACNHPVAATPTVPANGILTDRAGTSASCARNGTVVPVVQLHSP
ncbi:hypothetical protein WL80_17465 [Burkholderia ubonensis]|nr:hypothetical protein WJ60_19220 [Burkholderia ubonensis]KVZ06957.1 hypothetical protein WL11_11990 [Burkholderia ubonensis]KWE89164.1 hypothetical protein WL80_17465 [Burkholderia ubonensis]